MSTRLEARELTGGYPGLTVFSNVNFAVESGQILAILGANGSGKSALLETLQGLLASRGGVLLLDGEPVQELAPELRARRGVSLVSDRRRLWNEMTVAEHLRLGAFRAAARPGWRDRGAAVGAIFTGLASRGRARPGDLSGGFQQQLALARFAMSRPRVWLLDDPLQGLDDAMRGSTLEWIRRGAGDGAAVIVTGQHIRELLGLATAGMLLDEGRLEPVPVGDQGLRDDRVRRLL